MTEDWTKEWERRIVNGVYPLRRFLGRSSRSVVFLTECKEQGVAQAAIKIMPAIPALTDAQLEHWRKAATLSHPHLIRLLDSGRCQLGGHNFLFVVTELAEQNLAQILPGRPLTPEEVRDLLPPTLDALAYLHGRNLLQGGLKPPNFLVVDDQLKLASDTIRPAGERSASTAKLSSYDPPEAENGSASTAGDLWGLGITLVEALTQTPPAWSRERSEAVSLPADLAPEFVDTIQRCLNRDPGQRPTIAELAAPFNPAPLAPVELPASVAPPAPVAPPVSVTPPATAAPPTSAQPAPVTPPASAPSAVPPPIAPPPPVAPPASAAPPPIAPSPPLVALPASVAPAISVAPSSPAAPVVNAPLARTPSTQTSPQRWYRVAAFAAAIIALGVIWIGVRVFHTHATVQQPAAITPQPPATVAPPAAAETPKATISALPPTVLHQEMPDVSRSARQTIRGVIKIGVRVIVDRSGEVVAATLDHRASSRYFARAALDAAREWQFAPATDEASRVWLLRFEFTRAGTTARAVAVR